TSLVELLTPREQDILALIIEGLSNKEIARRLTVELSTVKWYVNQIYSKMGVRSRVQAIVRARELNLITRAGESAASATPIPTEDFYPENPYKGLRAFQAADYQDYFGREKVTARLIKRLGETGDYSRFLAVIGPSGSGKSSLVKAGLIPAIWRGDLPGSEKWFVAEMLPGSHPLDELEVALTRIAANQTANLNEQLRRDERGLLRTAGLILPNDESELLLVIDQFEEVFTLLDDEAARVHFLNLLHTAVSEARSRVRVVITMRADFYDRPLHYPQFGDLVRTRLETIMPLSAEELEGAITGPARRVGVGFEPGLVAAIIGDVNYQPGALPLLQYALTELFEQRQGRLLTREAYHQIGGAVGALAKRAEELYLTLNASDQETARQMFLRLVTLGEGTEDTRRRTTRAELQAITPDSDALDEIIDTFAAYRLLSLDTDPGTRAPTVEVAHEALLREWERLRAWLNDGRDEIRLQRQLNAMTTEWEQARREISFLATGSRLEAFESWVSTTRMVLTLGERAYLEASITQRDHQAQAEIERIAREKALERRSLTFLRALAAVLLLAMLGAVVLTAVAFSERDNAQGNFLRAERIRLASQAQLALNRGEGGDVPALLALRSIHLGYTPEADAALLNALTRGFTRQIYRGHHNAIENVIFSADGLLLLTAGDDNTARLWNVQTGQELQRFYQSSSWMATLSPDGRYVVTAGLDGNAVLWDVSSGEELHRFSEFRGGVNWVEFSPDSQSFAAADNDSISLWDVRSYQLLANLVGHTNKVYVVRFSSDGRYLVSGSVDNTARLWDVTTAEIRQEFIGHTECPCGASISPDGRYIATGSLDQTARLWDAETGQELKRYIGHTDAIYEIHFSPDGRYLLTPSLDKTVRLWDIASGQEIRRFIGHTAPVNQAVFSPDGQYIVTASSDRTARLWDVAAQVEPRELSTTFTGHDSYYFSAVLSHDNRFVLTGSGDGRLRRWDFQTGKVIEETMLANIAALNDLDISADGNVVVTGDSDGAARLWDSQTGQTIHEFIGHTATVINVAFSPDGIHVLTGSDDRTARLWEVQSGASIRAFTGHTGSVLDGVFTPDGMYVLTGSDDRTARLWEVQTGREIRQFAGHSDTVSTVAISLDGRYVLTGSFDHTARLWDLQTGHMIREFIGHTDQVRRVTFSPDGRYALTGSGDQTVRLWDVQTGQEVRRLVGHLQPIDFVGFSSDGQYVITGDRRLALIWQTHLEDVIAYACTHLSADLTPSERTLYNVPEDEPVCPEFRQTALAVLPTWTPFDTKRTVQATMPPLITQIEFYSDVGNIQMGFPMQDVYVVKENQRGVMRVMDLNDEVLALPLYSSDERIPQDYEPPIDIGPFPRGEPLGFTVAEWIAAKGQGTYTLQGGRATLDLTFDNLVSNGLYTLWCVKLAPLPYLHSLEEKPCGIHTGSDSTFTANANGSAAIRLEMDAFPPSTSEYFYEIVAAYHSDGRTYGPHPGDFGRNVHTQLFYDFLPPGT
ncbi:MAG: hypothetical protein JNJ61_06995, partial [Anaerolineae bacterium]|nr:hypothetical protein [Anaerolineae bacterium]